MTNDADPAGIQRRARGYLDESTFSLYADIPYPTVTTAMGDEIAVGVGATYDHRQLVALFVKWQRMLLSVDEAQRLAADLRMSVELLAENTN